jgi:transcriptional regulator with XRE-family HTH domain
MASKQELGERIRNARHAKGWKQKHLAAEVEVEPITVSRWERGATTPDLNVLGLIADATEKPLSYFVGAEAPTQPPASLEDAVARVERAAATIAAEGERIAVLLEELRGELGRRGGA